MIYTSIYKTPDGFDDIVMSSNGEYLSGLWFYGTRDCKYMMSNVEDELPVFKETFRWLDCYFGGRQPEYMPQYIIENPTPFRKEVLSIVSKIPFGKTVTYGEIADKIAQKHEIAKMSAQAVGGAVGWNPICIIIPCHRVIGANHKLTGYGGGMMNKVALLRLEGIYL